MAYAQIERRLQNGGIVILDGGTGTELERRGVPMDPEAWCGRASLDHADVLESIHRDYIAAGADIITANTFASSRLMLDLAGLGGRFEEINRTAVAAAHRARRACDRPDVLVAGSVSHMVPMLGGTAKPDLERTPTQGEMGAAFGEMAVFLRDEGCDLILLEMMHHPDRMDSAFEATTKTGLPVWAGFSARRGENGQVLSFTSDRDVPFRDVVKILTDFDVAAAGIMHTPSDLIGEALVILREVYDGPLTAYPDSGYFKMPQWQFEDVIAPDALLRFATGWVDGGVQVIGGCCGLSPAHIAAIAPLKERRPR